ncbi:MAG: sugar transferase [Desulfobacterales bacterium]|nr:sugar transferase [Desulfobacterales bacterium]
MISIDSTFNKRLQILLDLGITVLALILSYYLRSGLVGIWHESSSPLSRYLWLLPLILPIWGMIFNHYKDYLSHDRPLAEVCFVLLKVTTLSILLLILILYVTQAYRLNRTLVFVFFPLNYLLLVLEKGTIKYILKSYFKDRKLYYRQVFIIGTGQRVQRFIERVRKNKDWRIRINGLIDKDKDLLGKDINGIKVVGLLKDIDKLIKEKRIDELFFIAPRSWLAEFQDIFAICESAGIKLRLELDLFNPIIARTVLEEFYGHPTLVFTTLPAKHNQLFFKMIFDITASFFLLALLSPVFLLIAIGVKLTSPGPVLFCHTRTGLNARQFTLYKFRSMQKDAHQEQSTLAACNEMTGGGLFKMDHDPRITPFGEFLRKTSLDEFPQFYNVLKGAMSMVGPRALSTRLDQYETWQRRRLSMKPGITCLWQIEKRRQVDFDEWMKFDLEYIDNWSLWLDFKILLKTFWVVLRGKGAR